MILTPRTKEKIRLELDLNDEDSKKISRGRGWKATVTDQKTGKRYEVKAASCGLPECFCDAIAKELP